MVEPIHRTTWIFVALVAALLAAGCDKKSEASGTDDDAFDCAAHAKQLGGAALEPLETTPSTDRSGECYRSMSASLGGNDVWRGTFAGPFTDEDEWTAFLRGERVMPNGLRIAIGGLQGDGEFTVVPPGKTMLPAAGEATLFLAVDGEVEQGLAALDMKPTLAAVDGTVVVSGMRDAEFGPPLMTAEIEVTLKRWNDGAPEGEPIELRTTLEQM